MRVLHPDVAQIDQDDQRDLTRDMQVIHRLLFTYDVCSPAHKNPLNRIVVLRWFCSTSSNPLSVSTRYLSTVFLFFYYLFRNILCVIWSIKRIVDLPPTQSPHYAVTFENSSFSTCYPHMRSHLAEAVGFNYADSRNRGTAM